MFDGKRFFPDTGTPMLKIARISTEFEDCEPEPFTVATVKLKSLTMVLTADSGAPSRTLGPGLGPLRRSRRG